MALSPVITGEASSIAFDIEFSKLKRPNARHQPPRIQHIEHGVLRMRTTLFAVGCMMLLDAACV
jgi:hypothetical protein